MQRLPAQKRGQLCLGLRQRLRLQFGAVTGAGADHQRQQTRRTAQLAPVKSELSRCRAQRLAG
jgi:hypothetical protein